MFYIAVASKKIAGSILEAVYKRCTLIAINVAMGGWPSRQPIVLKIVQDTNKLLFALHLFESHLTIRYALIKSTYFSESHFAIFAVEEEF